MSSLPPVLSLAAHSMLSREAQDYLPGQPGLRSARSRTPSVCSNSTFTSTDSQVDMGYLKDDTVFEDWVQSDDESKGEKIKCFFCDYLHPDSERTLSHCTQIHSFDFLKLCRDWKLDMYGRIRLVNFVRSRVALGEDVTRVLCFLAEGETSKKTIVENDDLLKPVMQDDALLFNLEDDSDDEEEKIPPEVAERERLRNENAWLREMLTEKEEKEKIRPRSDSKVGTDDAGYFESYARFSIHQAMLCDKVRTDSYRDAILKNKNVFEGKVVLDVGCGTGILSMFAAQAGARMVIAVDNSAVIEHARAIIAANGFSDKIVCIRGKMEEITLPVSHVDIIVSEWMGYLLLYESMLETVLFARDRYLSPNGLVMPDRAQIFLAAVHDKDHPTAFWESDIYGFNMSSVKNAMEAELSKYLDEAEVAFVDSRDIMSPACLLKGFDLKTVSSPELDFKVPFQLVASRDEVCHGFVAYFDIAFLGSENQGGVLGNPVEFTTGSHGVNTHWKQTYFNLKTPLKMLQNQTISGTFELHRSRAYHRQLDVCITYSGADGPSSTQLFSLR